MELTRGNALTDSQSREFAENSVYSVVKVRGVAKEAKPPLRLPPARI